MSIFAIHNTESFSIFLEEAMKKGYVVVKLVKVIVVGPAGVGKTCLIYLLLSKPPPDKRHSTGCAERSIRVIRIGKEKEDKEGEDKEREDNEGEDKEREDKEGEEIKWSEIPTEKFMKMIAEAVPILYNELTDKTEEAEENKEDVIINSVSTDEDEVDMESEQGREAIQPKVGGTMGEYEENITMSNIENSDEPGSERMGVEAVSGTEYDAGAQSRKAVIDDVIQRLTTLVSSGNTSRRLLDMELIYLTDCGGQQAYWDLAPIFMRDTSATLFVHRLCEKLDEHPLNDLYQSGKRVGPEQRARLTTAQAFQTMLQGLDKAEKRSKIIVVGTHKDLLCECDETPKYNNELLTKIALPHFEDEVVYCNDSMEDVVFQINTKNPEDDDKKEASKIRSSIHKVATYHKIPIRWFIFQQILEALAEKLNRKVLSKGECNHVSIALDFSEGELEAALSFLDKWNIFLYKKDILPDIIFTDSQVPLDKLSVLVEKQYHLKAAEKSTTEALDMPTTGCKAFRDKGILTLDFLKEFKQHYVDGIFTAENFLTLLQKLLIISKLSDTEYFIPAILNSTKECQIKKLLASSSNIIAPRVVQFPTRWAPPGVFCCSVCHLQSHAGWEIKKPSKYVSNPTAKTYMSRNAITFTKRGRPGSVTFIDNLSFFAVCVDIGSSNIHGERLIEHCKNVESEVLAAVKAGLKMTHHKEWPNTIRSEVLAVVEETLNNAHLKESCAQAVKFEVSAALVEVDQETSGPAIMSSVSAAVEKGLNKTHHTDDCYDATKISAEVKKKLAKLDPEVAFLCPKQLEKLRTSCVWSYVQGIQSGFKSFFFRQETSESELLCDEEHLCESELHTACVSESELICDKNPNFCDKLTSAHTVWLGGSGIYMYSGM